ncbi:MAG: hypothetical protein CTY25_08685 [Methylobacterium sp.]|nr:MAG: hypothetical protein CTY25_08685 [Methylobacterium sp.]
MARNRPEHAQKKSSRFGRTLLLAATFGAGVVGALAWTGQAPWAQAPLLWATAHVSAWTAPARQWAYRQWSALAWGRRPDRIQPERVAAPADRPMVPPGEGPSLSPLVPRLLGQPGHFRRHVFVEPPYDMIDALRFSTSGDQMVVLTGIITPATDAACENPDRTLWPCGIFARATLYALIRGQQLVCHAQVGSTATLQESSALVGQCRVQGKDVATELVRVGFARPNGLASRAMMEAEAEARADRRGLWRSDWKIVQRN